MHPLLIPRLVRKLYDLKYSGLLILELSIFYLLTRRRYIDRVKTFVIQIGCYNLKIEIVLEKRAAAGD